MRGHLFHTAAVTLVLASGILYSTSTGNSDTAPQDSEDSAAELLAPELSITLANGELLLKGATTSDDHEARLLRQATEQFQDFDRRSEFVPGLLLPKSWEAASSQLLYTLAVTESASASMGIDSIRIAAVVTERDDYLSREALLREAAGPDVKVTSELVTIAVDTPLDELCEQSFSKLILNPVSFEESSTDMRRSSLASIDRLIEFGNDCPKAVIGITGHSDASGDAGWNRQLSLARAQAVADHMIGKGIPEDQLVVTGRGADEPIADNATALGRELNRRIEFELR